MSESADYDDEDRAAASWVKRGALLLGLCLAVAAGGLLLHSFLSAPAGKSHGVHQIALINQPPPPPPKPPEKPPEPPKVKEEVKVDEPKPAESKPAENKPADDKPASDKPLGVDAAGQAGADGFGLVGSRGGRDLLSTGGGGGRGAYYTGLLQRQFFEALSRNRKVLHDQFRVVVRISLGEDGRVQRADIVDGSGNAEVDALIHTTLLEMPALRDVPPLAMRKIEMRLSNRS